MQKFSVLMSIYYKEKPEYARQCFESLLRQTVQADEWLIVEDGPLTDELYELLNEYENKYPNMIKRLPLSTNQGLGLALRAGIEACKYDMIARMDTDDIAHENRFEKQLLEFEKNDRVDICGTQIDEFEETPDRIVAHRTVPIHHDEIVEYQKNRDAFNHMTVMYKREAVLRAGNYESCPLMEDTYLWVRMIQSGSYCMNIDESLVYARIGHDMYERRGGWSYLKKYKEGRKIVRETGYISAWDYWKTIIIQFVVAIMPSKLRGIIFKKLLHR